MMTLSEETWSFLFVLESPDRQPIPEAVAQELQLAIVQWADRMNLVFTAGFTVETPEAYEEIEYYETKFDEFRKGRPESDREEKP